MYLYFKKKNSDCNFKPLLLHIVQIVLQNMFIFYQDHLWTNQSSLFVLRFYGPVNPVGSCRARSVYLTTRLLDRLSPLSG